MKKTPPEDWEFSILVTSAAPCRLGLEEGDLFSCQYGCPAGFCPKTMGNLHRLCDVARAGGDYRLLGGSEKGEIDFCCADGCVQFHLSAHRLY
ncbi:MAG: TIGR04076 family protein [Provencibacterium sp.]|jgi:uncharacterized repeat protein (TIGR04076 family)|nr:TIGR04076 family protein [Provencibacterium sp.]